MTQITLTTFDWVPEFPRGYVRDLRARWALEEAGLSYRVATTPFEQRSPDHLEHQPFNQVPWLSDGERSIFESGAILLHLGELSPVLLPADSAARAEAVEWLFAALNSVEMASLPWVIFKAGGQDGENAGWKALDQFLSGRLARMEAVLADRQWLASGFSIADIAMADVLRLVDRFGGLADYAACRAYVARALARPAFVKAHDDQLKHFAEADAERAAS